MYNLPKFDSEKAAKNVSKTYQSRYVQNRRVLLCFKKRCGSDFNGRAEWATHFSVTTEGIDKPVFHMVWIAGYVTTNGVHVACKELE